MVIIRKSSTYLFDSYMYAVRIVWHQFILGNIARIMQEVACILMQNIVSCVQHYYFQLFVSVAVFFNWNYYRSSTTGN